MEEFDYKKDAEDIRDFLFQKNEEIKLINLITKRTNNQRQQIKKIYKEVHNSEIFDDIEKKLSGNFRRVVKALFYAPIDYDCYQLRKAVKGLGTDEEAIIEILCTRPPDIIEQIKIRYSEMYPGRTLINDIDGDTSGTFKKILLSLLQANRKTSKDLNEAECEKYAKMLYEAGEKKIGTDENIFVNIFTKNSSIEIMSIAQFYYKLTSHTLLQAVESEFSFNSKNCLCAIIYALLSPSEFFAKMINKAVKGLGTNDSSLIRILVTRNEIDMYKIRQYYKQLYQKDMIDDIKDDTSGHYQKILVELASKKHIS